MEQNRCQRHESRIADGGFSCAGRADRSFAGDEGARFEAGLAARSCLPGRFVPVNDIPCNIVPVHQNGVLADIATALTDQPDSITGSTLHEGMEERSALGDLQPVQRLRGGPEGRACFPDFSPSRASQNN